MSVQNNPTVGCLQRLKKEYQHLIKDPIPNFKIYLDPDNILKWYFCIYNLDKNQYPEYHHGEYYGLITMHHNYPFSPPSYHMLTPSGRFEVNKSICTTNSGFHLKDWNPLWGPSTLLRGFLSLFLDTYTHTDKYAVGHVVTTSVEKIVYAKQSCEYNQKHNLELKNLFETNEDVIMSPLDRPKPKIQIRLKNKPSI